MLVPLTLTKQVQLDNYRLKVFFNAVLFATVVSLLADFIINSGWSSEQDFSDRIHCVPRLLGDKLQEAANQDVCKASRMYEYVSAHDAVNFTNLGCLNICDSRRRNMSCIALEDLVQVEDTSIFFVTALSINSFTDDDKPWENHWHHAYLTPYEKSYQIYLTYGFKLQDKELKQPRNFWAPSHFEGHATENALTVLFDVNGRQQRVIHPGEYGIALDVLELLRLAGRPHFLDESQSEFGLNNLQGASVTSGPKGRITGADIPLILHCYNTANVPNFVNIRKLNWKGPVCTLGPTPLIPFWISRTMRTWWGGSQQETTLYGVRVHIIKKGSLRMFDLTGLLSWIARTLVLLRVPRMVFAFLMQHGMGTLSKIWNNVIIEHFVLPKHICSLAVDILSKNVVYHELADKVTGLSFERMNHGITQSLEKFEDLDSSEIQAFSLFCFRVAFDLKSFSQHKLARSMTGKVRRSIQSVSPPAPMVLSSDELRKLHLGIHQFAEASNMANELNLQHVVQLFDRDRKRTVLERIFVPGWMERYVFTASSQARSQVTASASDQLQEKAPRVPCLELSRLPVNDPPYAKSSGKSPSSPQAEPLDSPTPSCQGQQLNDELLGELHIKMESYWSKFESLVDVKFADFRSHQEKVLEERLTAVRLQVDANAKPDHEEAEGKQSVDMVTEKEDDELDRRLRELRRNIEATLHQCLEEQGQALKSSLLKVQEIAQKNADSIREEQIFSQLLEERVHAFENRNHESSLARTLTVHSAGLADTDSSEVRFTTPRIQPHTFDKPVAPLVNVTPKAAGTAQRAWASKLDGQFRHCV